MECDICGCFELDRMHYYADGTVLCEECFNDGVDHEHYCESEE